MAETCSDNDKKFWLKHAVILLYTIETCSDNDNDILMCGNNEFDNDKN